MNIFLRLILIYFCIVPFLFNVSVRAQDVIELSNDNDIYNNYAKVIENNQLETKEGYEILGDLNFKNECFTNAAQYYFKAFEMDKNNIDIQNKIAKSYLNMGYIKGAENFYLDVLEKKPENVDAQLGIGLVEYKKRHFLVARQKFNAILDKNPDFVPAKIAKVKTFIANDERLSALEILEEIPNIEEKNYLKAQIFYDLDMHSDSKDYSKNLKSKEASVLREKLYEDDALRIKPDYSFYFQTLSDFFTLDYQLYGFSVAKRVKNNSKIFLIYNAHWYTSGAPFFLSNLTNEFTGGVEGRPTKNLEYKVDLGVKDFQSGNGAMIITDSWIKYYFNDFFNLKVGYRRNNLEQSYLSAVGQMVNGQFTGRVANSKLYIGYEAKLPYDMYSSGYGAFGVMYGQNMVTNPFFETQFIVGKNFYKNPENSWIQSFSAEIKTYNTNYQYDQLYLYDIDGIQYGGYFSPSFYNATTLHLKLEGEIKKLKLKYGVTGFGGIQTAMSPDSTQSSWGYSPYISWHLNDKVRLDASYVQYNYADIRRDLFMMTVVVKLFKKKKVY